MPRPVQQLDPLHHDSTWRASEKCWRRVQASSPHKAMEAAASSSISRRLPRRFLPYWARATSACCTRAARASLSLCPMRRMASRRRQPMRRARSQASSCLPLRQTRLRRLLHQRLLPHLYLILLLPLVCLPRLPARRTCAPPPLRFWAGWDPLRWDGALERWAGTAAEGGIVAPSMRQPQLARRRRQHSHCRLPLESQHSCHNRSEPKRLRLLQSQRRLLPIASCIPLDTHSYTSEAQYKAASADTESIQFCPRGRARVIRIRLIVRAHSEFLRGIPMARARALKGRARAAIDIIKTTLRVNEKNS